MTSNTGLSVLANNATVTLIAYFIENSLTPCLCHHLFTCFPVEGIVVSLSTNILHHLPANRENKGKYLQYFVLTNNLEIVYQFLDFSYPYQVNVAAKRAFSCEKRLKE